MLQSGLNELRLQLGRFAPRYRLRGYREKTATTPVQNLVPEVILDGLGETSRRMAMLYAWILQDIDWSGNARHRLAIDVGAKDFVYASVLHHFLTARNHPQTRLLGLEADPYRLYWNLYRRGDRGRYFAENLNRRIGDPGRVQYRGANWLDWAPETECDLITCFFPFLDRRMSLRWGLPNRFYFPEALYRKAIRQSGSVLFLHLGEQERTLSEQLVQEIGVGQIRRAGEFRDNPWWPVEATIHALLWQR